jgi:hypothetical protein
MGNSIDKISDKFFISSVEPLGDKRRIDELGVTHILNGAEEHLFALILPHFNSALFFRFKFASTGTATPGGGTRASLTKLWAGTTLLAKSYCRSFARLRSSLNRFSSFMGVCILAADIVLGRGRRWHNSALRCWYISQHLLLPCLPHGQKAHVSQLRVLSPTPQRQRGL